MNSSLQLDPITHQLSGSAGSLPLAPTDLLAHRFLMLVEGQCLEDTIAAVAQKYGYCRQRYYQLLHDFRQGGLQALEPLKTGPKSNYRRTWQATLQVMRHKFLDPEASPEVITQKLRQTHFPTSLRSVQRMIADLGLQKKTLHPQSPKPAPAAAHSARRKPGAPRTRRRPKH
ncbi:MAG: helix-turn-helix domain-containing protein [Terriglobia bacterium]